MARKSKRNVGSDVKLEMTPMIDVVFQLLIFFIVTLKQEDILSQLDFLRPAGQPTKAIGPDPITITVTPNGYIYNRLAVSEAKLNDSLAKLSKFNKGTTVVIKCTATSPHGLLVRALDLCANNGITQTAVFSQ